MEVRGKATFSLRGCPPDWLFASEGPAAALDKWETPNCHMLTAFDDMSSRKALHYEVDGPVIILKISHSSGLTAVDSQAAIVQVSADLAATPCYDAICQGDPAAPLSTGSSPSGDWNNSRVVAMLSTYLLLVPALFVQLASSE
jgi:hypothetical protein